MGPVLGIVAMVLVAAYGPSDCSGPPADKVQADLTIYVAGDLLARGGVVSVRPLPVPAARWREIGPAENQALSPPNDLKPIAQGGKRLSVVLDRRFGEVQFLYPETDTYTFRFRPHPDAGRGESAPAASTRVLTIGGTDFDGRGREMTVGFAGLHTSGDQTIQVVAAEMDEADARVLAALRDGVAPKPLACLQRTATSVCTYPDSIWPEVEREWRRGIEDFARERRRWSALNRCYRSAEREGRTGGHCDLVDESSQEPVYRYRP